RGRLGRSERSTPDLLRNRLTGVRKPNRLPAVVKPHADRPMTGERPQVDQLAAGVKRRVIRKAGITEHLVEIVNRQMTRPHGNAIDGAHQTADVDKGGLWVRETRGLHRPDGDVRIVHTHRERTEAPEAAEVGPSAIAEEECTKRAIARSSPC